MYIYTGLTIVSCESHLSMPPKIETRTEINSRCFSAGSPERMDFRERKDFRGAQQFFIWILILTFGSMVRYSSSILRRIFIYSVISWTFISCGIRKSIPEPTGQVARDFMVVSASLPASKAGQQILEKGGNAIDAAIAVQFALAVTYPRAGNIGGGGFAVIRTADGESRTLDFREKASRHAYRDLYLDDAGEVIPRLSLDGHLASGVPGSVMGMQKLHEWRGRLPWKELLQPAIDLARHGFPVSERQARTFNGFRELFLTVNKHNIPLMKEGGWQAGDTLRLPDLAETLTRIRDHGADGFYKGKTAQLIVQEIESGNGIIDYTDLERYEARWRPPLEKTFKDLTVLSMPPPSSGGIALLQMLKSLENIPLNRYSHNSAAYIHYLAEVEKRAYADRATYLGDPDFHDIPVDMLLSESYLRSRTKDITATTVTPSSEIKEGHVEVVESVETTHFSVVDSEGNAVAITTTINSNFGSKVWVDGGGFFLNNEMDDFSVKPGVPNQFGLLGNEINAVEAEKRMLSSMTPTILLKKGKPYVILGSPGGSTIMTTVLQTILNVTEFNMSMQEAVDAKRVHHQWMPDIILHEKEAFSEETRQELLKMGYQLQDRGIIGACDAIMIYEDGRLEGAPDHLRGDNASAGK